MAGAQAGPRHDIPGGGAASQPLVGRRLLAGRRLLVLNWRDSLDPHAGGAEVFCWAMASLFAESGAEVTLFTATVRGLPATEVREGVRIVRRGGSLSLYPAAGMHMLLHRNDYDAVLEFQNGIPFFAPLFVRRRTPVVRVMHHVHQEQFRLHFPWPVSEIGRFLEAGAARVVFGSNPIAVVSPSTRQGVRGVLHGRGPVFVIPNGSRPAGSVPAGRERAPAPTIVSVGRLSKHKRVDLLLTIAAAIVPEWPSLQVDIVGDGPERARLERRAHDLGIDGTVRFHGHVSSELRDAIVARAWLAVIPSDGEGWCLSVIEANAAGVPAAGRSVAGLRDSIRPKITGWLAESEDDLPGVISAALGELSSEQAAERWTSRCRDWAGQYSWDATADRLATVIAGELDLQGERGRRRDRRGGSDLSCLVEVEIDDPDRFVQAAERGLRRTELLTVEGSQARLLLHGCDARDAVACLRRLGYARVTAARVARGHDLLIGPAATSDEGRVAAPEAPG